MWGTSDQAPIKTLDTKSSGKLSRLGILRVLNTVTHQGWEGNTTQDFTRKRQQEASCLDTPQPSSYANFLSACSNFCLLL